jgi:lipopolysaccharide/colanic/teichoic acid biosynthesis glycosyltransferase
MFYRRYGKRLFDLTLAACGLVLLSPLFALIALAIKLTSRGPVFYVQERVGRHGAPFPFIKFRTMVVGAETQGAGIHCLKDDPRVTKAGRLLRRFSLDEAPQLINVLRGEMSVIGPRPGLAYQFKAYTPFQRRRLDVLPGITGWAQVNGRNAIAWDQRIVRDVEYIERLSLAMDLRILLRTVHVVLGRDNLIADRDYFKTREAQSGEPH